MPTHRTFHRSFAGGEVSPELFGRVDDTRFQTGAAKVLNFIALPQGMLMRRPGLRYVDTAFAGSQPVRVIKFDVTTELGVALQVGEGYIRFHAEGGTLAPRPYVAGQVVTFATGTGIVTFPTPHLLEEDDELHFNTSGTPPTGLSNPQNVFANVLTATTIRVKTTFGGDPITSYASSGSGSHSIFFQYREGEFVRSGGVTYYCIVDHVDHDPPNVSFWENRGSANVLQLDTPYDGDDVFDIHHTQSHDVMTLVHTRHRAMELRRFSGNRWTLEELSFESPVTAPGLPLLTTSPIISQNITSIAAGADPIWTTAAPHGAIVGDEIYVTATVVNPGTTGNTVANADTYVVSEVVIGGATNTLRAKTKAGALLNGGAGPGGLTGGTFTFAGLNSRVTVEYKVTAVDEDNRESLASVSASVVHNMFADGAFVDISWSAVTGAERYNVYKKSNGLFGFIGQTQSTSFRDDNIAPDLGKTIPIQDDDLDGADYPGAVAYFEQRRCFAGTRLQPEHVWMTRTGTESDLTYHLPVVDDDRVSFAIASRESNDIRHLVPMSHLVILTNSAEYRVTPLNSDAITPDSVAVRPQSYVGSNNVQPCVVNNTLVFCAARGGHAREMGFQQDVQGYQTGDLSLRAAHLFDGLSLVDMAYQKAPYPVQWFVSSSGKLLGLTYVPEEGIGGWHQHTTDGVFESCCVVAEGAEDIVYVVVRRTIGGSSVRYIECMAPQDFGGETEDAFFVDSGLTYEGTATRSITGLTHLAGETVAILADGEVQAEQTVSGSGTITLARAATKVQVGLPYDSDMQTVPAVLSIDAYAQGNPKALNRAYVRTLESAPFKVGLSETEADMVSTDPNHEQEGLADAVVDVVTPTGWTADGQLYVRQGEPLPLNIVSLVMEVSVG